MDYSSLNDFLSVIKKALNPNANELELVKKAWNYSSKAHEGQTRDSGEKYFIHPVRVSIILLKSTNCDVEMIIAALLHDVVEDTNVAIEDIQREFNSEVAILVDGLTKVPALDEVYEKDLAKEISKRKSIQKLFRAISADMRIALIKLADRLHNLRTLGAKGSTKIERICNETLLIYVPLSEILGVGIIHQELQDLAFKLAYPDEYDFISKKIMERDDEYKQYINEITTIIEDSLDEYNIKARVYKRRKEPYSIFSKLKVLGLDLEDIYDVYDIIGFRIIVKEESIEDCYRSLSIVNDLGNNYRFDDYIQTPRGPHKYKALHKVFISDTWGKVEVQIRTALMHYNAERGTAPHWKYKMDVELSNHVEERLIYLSDIIDQNDFDISDLEKAFAPFIRVITPNNESVFLPKDATILDFAYRIHSVIGDECIGAKVKESNGKVKYVKIDWNITHLSEVDIIRKPGGKPSISWITGKKAKTKRAIKKIQAYFNKENRKEAVEKGKEYFNKYSKLTEKNFSFFSRKDLKKNLLASLKIENEENLYHYIATDSDQFRIKLGEIIVDYVLKKQGYGKDKIMFLIQFFSEKKIIQQPLRRSFFLQVSASEINLDDINKGLDVIRSDKAEREQKQKGNSNLVVRKGLSILLSNCCNPIYGDEIVGLGSRNGYIKIHRKNCLNIFRLDSNRFISYNWSDLLPQFESALFKVTLEIEFMNSKNNTRNTVKDIFNENGVVIEEEVKKKQNSRDPKTIYNYTVVISENKVLEKINKQILNLDEVVSIVRDFD